MPAQRATRIDAAGLVSLHAAAPHRYPFLLESTASGTALGRYSLLLACPGERLELQPDGSLTGPHAEEGTGAFLAALDAWWRDEREPRAATPLPFSGGWFLFLGYELAAQVERSLVFARATDGPVATAVRVPAAIVLSHETGDAWLVAESTHAGLLGELQADIDRLVPTPQPPVHAGGRRLIASIVEDPPDRFLRAVAQALEHVAAGDIYQANLSRGWTATLADDVDAIDVYRQLRAANPGPFAGLARVGNRTIISSSPERLVELRGHRIATRPIAGTRPRGDNPLTDRGLARELRRHPKEQAEHVMLIDLERNDLGRVCEPGSVVVDEFMVLESYAHVHHIVSNVSGRLRPDITPGAAIAAVFPGGTITGCPKVRCMQIIAALEGVPRGAYTGSMGYLNRDGSLDLNILIRTLEMAGRQLTFRAGAGIVADSVPERELEETRAKARGMLRALGLAEGAA